MRIFVTGATGYIGSAVVQELMSAGHQVIGLARSDAASERLRAVGAEVHRGDLENLNSLHRGAAQADGVIHTAFIHDFSKYQANCEIDRRAIEALGTALEGTERPLVVTSGCGVHPEGKMMTEDQLQPSGTDANPRMASEEAADALVTNGGHVSIVRLPPTVHGEGDHGFIHMLIGIAREKGVSAYIGDGQNCWPSVHRLDAAKLYHKVLMQGTPGARYHGVAEEGIPLREIASVIGRQLHQPVVSKNPEEAPAHFGWFTPFAGLHTTASSQKTQQLLGWKPTQPGLLEDLAQEHYFARENHTMVG